MSSARVHGGVLLRSVVFALLSTRAIASAGSAEFLSAPITPGSFQTIPTGVSGDGLTVFGYATYGDFSTRPVIWRLGDGIAVLPTDETFQQDGSVDASSFDGSVLGGRSIDISGRRRATYWINGEGPHYVVAGNECFPVAIHSVSRNGMIFAGDAVCERSDEPEIIEGFRVELGGVFETIGQIEDMPYRAQTRSVVHAMSGDGSVIVGTASTGDQMPRAAVRWVKDDGLAELPLPEPGESDAYAVSGNGQAAAGQVEVGINFQAALWEAGEPPEMLGDLPGGSDRSSASAMTPDASVVVGTSIGLGVEQTPQEEPFVWDRANGMRNLRTMLVLEFGLPLVGRDMSRVTGVSDNGRVIVGWGSDPATGSANGWMVRFIPDGDLNADTLVTSTDLGILLAAWGADDSAADLNGDGVVGPGDLGILLASWG